MATGIVGNKTVDRKKIPIYLMYEGKKSSDRILAGVHSDFSLFHSVNGGSRNRFYFGDNLDALLHMLECGYKEKIRLIYIDPPFATASSFVSRNQEQAYSDFLCGGEYVEFLRERLIAMRELLSTDGSIYLHLDGNMAFALKLVLDEVFGEKNFRAFITRKKCSTKNFTKKTYGNISDYILFYSKTSEYIWNRPYEPWDYDKMIEQYPCIDEQTGRRYKKVPIHAPGVRNGETGKEWRGKLPPKGKHWQYAPEKLDELDRAGEIYWSPTGNPRRKVFCDIDKGIPVQDIWLDYRDSVNQSQMTTGYPTEKNFDMVKRIITASSNQGDLVLDCFAGSGTTLGAAFDLKRRWIGVDNSPESMKAVLKRFVSGLDIYGDYVSTPREYKQIKIELFPKCPFDIFTNESEKSKILSILK